jgi:O-antigen ligase
MVWPLPDISDQFAWYKIAPHNSLLWIMMTTGIVGFALFWYVIGLVSIGSIRIARRLAGNVDKGIAVFAVLMLASLLIFALLDQGLLSMRTMLFSGVLLGAVFALRLNHHDDEIDSDDGEGGSMTANPT